MRDIQVTEELLWRPWLRGSAASTFKESYAAARGRFRGGSGRPVLVAERDPVDFSAVFFAALISGRAVVLGNPGWGRREWMQLNDLGLGETREDRGSRDGDTGASSLSGAAECQPGEILIPTGGSGGRLRFARHSWKTLAASAEGFAAFFGCESVKSVCVLPLYHVSGLMQVVRAVMTGGEIALWDWKRLESGEVPESAEGAFLSLVPVQLKRLLEVESLHGWLQGMRAIPVGGAAVSNTMVEEAARLRLPISLSYGATETAAMATAQTPEEFLGGARTSGRALPHVALRIRGDDGKEVEPGQAGQICVEGGSLFNGYIPGGRREEEEWMTGDLGSLDRDGCLTVIGRTDRVVVTGGENVFPEEVERVLGASGLVEDVYVFGREDAEWGRVVVAAYTSATGSTVEQLRAAVRAELTGFKVPKVWISLPEIPRSAQGKIDPAQLGELVRGLPPRT